MATQTLLDWMNEFTRKHGISTGDSGAVATATESDATLTAEYGELGGDRALLKVLAAEDHVFLARLDKQRVEARAAHRKLLDELEFRRHMLEMDMDPAKNSPAKIRSWWSEEMQTYRSIASRVEEQGPKLDSEPGRQLKMLLSEHEQSLDYYHDLAAQYERWVEQARPNHELIQERIADATETYEAIENRIRQTRTELDNMLELDAMTMEERVRRLRGGGTDESRLKAFRAIEIELGDFVRKNAEGMKDRTAWFDDKWNFRPHPIDWKPIEKQLALVERTDLDKLQQRDKSLDRLWNKYIDAGGDEALLRKRYKAWNKQQGRREQMNNVKSIGFRDEIAGMQSRLADAQLALRETQQELKDIAASQRAKKARARQLTAGAEAGELLSGREAAELKLIARDLKRSEADVETRQQLIAVHQDSIANVKELMKRTRDLYEHDIDDDQDVQWDREPRSEDLEDLPLRAKYDELTKKD